MARRPVHLARRTVPLIGLLAAGACINVFWHTEPRDLPARAVGTAASPMATEVRTPVKAHLRSGATVVFLRGATVTRTHVSGTAARYALMANVASGPAALDSVPLDSIVGLETFDGKVDPGATLVVSAAATVAGAFGTALLAVAIFGSCPTLYADTGSKAVLQAEGFSYAIAPLFRQRDIDPLVVARTREGVVRLELRNEALETHHIDLLELTRVTHAPNEVVVPDQRGGLVAVRDLQPPASARDREGRDVRAVLREADAATFASAPRRVAAARVGDLDDWIDLTVPAPGSPSTAGASDSLVVLLRLRNSLLNTILLYDGMLSGVGAMDWLSRDLANAAPALALGQWYSNTMGMRAIVDGVPLAVGGLSRTSHARLGDVGPIAFRDVALVLPRPRVASGEPVHVRLRFVADNWRIDQARIAFAYRRPPSVRVPVSRVYARMADGRSVNDSAVVPMLRASDERYLETRPGQRMTLEFDDADVMAADSTARYLVTWQGWYTEWVRPAWITGEAATRRFVPGDSAVVTAMTRWRRSQAAFEKQFYASPLPTR
ncbi:MAG: hypothetical protein K2R93_19165 [Gemmatimonadaceae bacterium]|nr:hypothetical protein [Gemmatimonadaceae bacterium]